MSKVVVHRAAERGAAEAGWLSTRYSFSFGNWHEPRRMGFGALRVLNDDTIARASGFPMHGHRDMEIVTFVTSGILTHQDSLGNVGTLRAGEVQVMSAGSGIVHSEYNASPTEPLTLFQIWIETAQKNSAPRYEERSISKGSGPETLLVAPEGNTESVPFIRQSAWITLLTLAKGSSHTYDLRAAGNGAYCFVLEGDITIAGETLGTRDAAGITSASEVLISAVSSARLLVIDVPMEVAL